MISDICTANASHLHVDNADAMIEEAVKARGKLTRKAQDHFHGKRAGTVRDLFEYDWLIGHSIEDVTPEEMKQQEQKPTAVQRNG